MKLNSAIIATLGFSLVGISAGAQNPPTPPPAQASQASSGQQAAPKPAQQQSLGDAARKAREQHKDTPAAKKSFTNDDLNAIRNNGVSTVGQPPAPPAEASKAGTPAPEPRKDEAYWRKRFAEARQKLALAEKELDILQRELNLNQAQYYADPNQALKQQYSRDDINEKTKKIEEKKQEVAQLQQGLVDMQDELRRSGGSPGWAN
jgi:hypothetical protein